MSDFLDVSLILLSLNSAYFVSMCDLRKLPAPSPTVQRSVLFGGFLASGFIADIDTLLDWRNRLDEMQREDKRFPAFLYDMEREAVDYFLSCRVELDAV